MSAVTMHHFSGLAAPFVRSKGTVSGGVFTEGYSSDNHIGIIVDVDGSDITVVEGNTSRRVRRVTYSDLYASSFGEITMLLSNHVSW